MVYIIRIYNKRSQINLQLAHNMLKLVETCWVLSTPRAGTVMSTKFCLILGLALAVVIFNIHTCVSFGFFDLFEETHSTEHAKRTFKGSSTPQAPPPQSMPFTLYMCIYETAVNTSAPCQSTFSFPLCTRMPWIFVPGQGANMCGRSCGLSVPTRKV